MISRAQMKSIKTMRKDQLDALLVSVYKEGLQEGATRTMSGSLRVDDVDVTKANTEVRELLRSKMGIGDTRYSRIEGDVVGILESCFKDLMKAMIENIRIEENGGNK